MQELTSKPVPCYIVCLHCDYLIEEGTMHLCVQCHKEHTPESTWEESK